MAKCQHCKLEISIKTIKKEKRGIGFIKQEILYSCPHCDCVLGISRGKWSG